MGEESKYFLICGLQGARPLTNDYGLRECPQSIL